MGIHCCNQRGAWVVHPQSVDESILNVVAQENVTLTNKGKASFRMPTVRSQQNAASVNFTVCQKWREGFSLSSRRPNSEKRLKYRVNSTFSHSHEKKPANRAFHVSNKRSVL